VVFPTMRAGAPPPGMVSAVDMGGVLGLIPGGLDLALAGRAMGGHQCPRARMPDVSETGSPLKGLSADRGTVVL